VAVSKSAAAMLLKLASWGSLTAVGSSDTCRAGQLASWLAPLPSFTEVQKRWHTWMRAVPSVLDMTAAAFVGGGNILPEDFVSVVGQTALPTTNAETLLMVQVLQRDPGSIAVEAHLLDGIAKGRFHHVIFG